MYVYSPPRNETNKNKAPLLPAASQKQADIPPEAVAAGQLVANLQQEIDELLSSGVYEEDDPVVVELQRNLIGAQQRFARMQVQG